jgi:hypothetical protein
MSEEKPVSSAYDNVAKLVDELIADRIRRAQAPLIERIAEFERRVEELEHRVQALGEQARP